MTRIAIVGMACRYPDATSPGELWENAVAGRRAFRRLPSVRMNLDDYWDADPTVPDTFYARNAAVLEGYEFDRIAHKISGGTYRSTDLTHWLALDTAGRALADAGFPGGEGLPRERTGVVVGNTLTGEFSRANVMRLRWPYVRRVMAEALGDQPDWDEDRVDEFLDDVEAAYKQPFPDINEDTLAGGLANTIAGRICNQFDLGGGGYTVDGACSSSLLSVTTAGTSLVNGDIDVAVAGGVDLSIDPFEIIGFAKTGALAKGEMKLYDRGSNGFWPGEGCGMIVMMREEDALAGNHRIYATIAGWGVSSDGQGGITRPEVSGYQLALKRAYDRAGFGIDTVALFEGHGTGTAVGDATELTALMGARAAADPDAPVAAITSIKGMIGHTKAAAGVAGLIKAAMAVDNQTLPPAIGTVDPHELLTAADANLKALRKAEAWPQGTPRRAGITAMGFGGINTHVVLDEPATRRRAPGRGRGAALAHSLQDAELLLLDAESPRELRARITEVADFVEQVSYGQVSDLAATLQRELRGLPHRAAVIVSSPEDAERRLRHLAGLLETGESEHTAADGRSHLGKATGRGRIGFLFPGQGSGQGTGGARCAAASPRPPRSSTGRGCRRPATWSPPTWRSRASPPARPRACASWTPCGWRRPSRSATASASSPPCTGPGRSTRRRCWRPRGCAAGPWPSTATAARWPRSPPRRSGPSSSSRACPSSSPATTVPNRRSSPAPSTRSRRSSAGPGAPSWAAPASPSRTPSTRRSSHPPPPRSAPGSTARRSPPSPAGSSPPSPGPNSPSTPTCPSCCGGRSPTPSASPRRSGRPPPTSTCSSRWVRAACSAAWPGRRPGSRPSR